MKKRLSVLLLTTLLISSIGFADVLPTAATTTYTLETALAALLKDNLDLKLAVLGVELAKVELDETTRANNRIRDIKDDGGYGSAYSELFGSAAGQYILKGVPDKGDTLALQMAEKGVALATFSLEMGLKDSYYSILSATETLRIKEQSALRLKELYDTSAKKFQLGLISKNALNTAKVDYDASLTAVETAKAGLSYEKMQFNQTMNLPLQTPVTVAGKLTYTASQPIDLNAKVAQALTSRMDVLTAKQSLEIAQLMFDVDKSFYGMNTAAYKKSYIALEKAKQNYSKSLTTAELAVRKAYDDMKAAERGYLDLKKSVELVKEGYEIAKTMYSVGLNTQTDVSQALIQYNTLENSLNGALLGYKLTEMLFESSYTFGAGK